MEPTGISGSSTKRLFKNASKRGRALPRRAQELSKEELLLTLQKKRECNAKALKIVERMLEPNVEEDWFLDVLKDINSSHLQDVAEERSIIKLCGYPLCSQELKHIPIQQFHISTKSNKVYDIQERKNFCSNKCFKSYNFVKDQMYTSPLWLRDIEPMLKFTLLPSSDPRGSVGDEVNVQIERVSREEVEDLSRDGFLSFKTTTQGTSTGKEKELSDLLDNLKFVESMRKTHLEDAESSRIVTDPSMSVRNVLEEVTAVSCIKQEVQAEERLDRTLRSSFSVDVDKQELHCPKVTEDMVASAVGLPFSMVKEFPVNGKESIPDSRDHSSGTSKFEELSLKDSEDHCLEEGGECKQIKELHLSCVNPDGRMEQVKTEVMGNVSKANPLSSQSNLTWNEKSIEPPLEQTMMGNESLEIQRAVPSHESSCETQSIPEPEHPQHSNNSARKPTQSQSVEEEREHSCNHFSSPIFSKDCTTAKVENSISCSKFSGKHKSKGSKRSKKEQYDCQAKILGPVALVEKCLHDWFTMETMCFLFGEQALKEMLEDKGESIQAHYKALSSITWDQEKHERFLTICKRLSLLEIEDSNYDNQVMKDGAETKLKPLPDYNALKKESETMNLKVKAFYRGKMEITDKKVSFVEGVKSESSDGTRDCEPHLPLVHLHSQRALRKRIVLDGLNRVLPDFLRTFGMRPSEISSSVRGLVGTFALSPTNITFKPQEWNLLGLVVIKILSLREPELRQRLQLEQSNTYLTLMLMSYNLERGYLDHLLSWLTDIDKLLERSSSSES